MIMRKKGETHEHYIERLESEYKKLQELAIQLKKYVDGLPLPDKYKHDAELMFGTLALIEAEIRKGGKLETVKVFAQATLEELGFNLVQIYSDECLKDGAYGKKA